MKKLSFLLALVIGTYFTSSAQRLKLEEGSLDVLKGQSAIKFAFGYENMSVGRYDKESDYVNKKKEDYNKKEPGRGDNWEKLWIGDRKSRFEPAFITLFTKESGMEESAKAKYTLIFNTTATEPGFNIYVQRKNAEINGEALIVETANPSKVLARISIARSPGRTFGGYDYDTGERISEAYEKAGKEIGKMVAKAIK